MMIIVTFICTLVTIDKHCLPWNVYILQCIFYCDEYLYSNAILTRCQAFLFKLVIYRFFRIAPVAHSPSRNRGLALAWCQSIFAHTSFQCQCPLFSSNFHQWLLNQRYLPLKQTQTLLSLLQILFSLMLLLKRLWNSPLQIIFIGKPSLMPYLSAMIWWVMRMVPSPVHLILPQAAPQIQRYNVGLGFVKTN